MTDSEYIAELAKGHAPSGSPEIRVHYNRLLKISAVLAAAPAQPVAHVSRETFNDDRTSYIITEAMPIGTALYAAPQPPAQAQDDDSLTAAYMAGANDAKRAQEARKPLTDDQIVAAVRAAHLDYCLGKFQTFEHALVYFTEQAHGIK